MAEVETLPYAKRIGLRSTSDVQFMDSVKDGLSYQALASLQRSMGLSTKEIAKAVKVSERTLARRKIERRLTDVESERLARVSRLFELAVSLFEGDEAAATRWFRKPAPALGDKTPLELVAMELGARQVENLIGRLEHGVFS